MNSVDHSGQRLFRNLAEGRTSLGVAISIPGPEIVDCYGDADWDVFYANMHSTRIDWSDLAHMNLAARAWGITPCARIPMQPWVGGHNTALATDAHRAFSLGSSVVMATVRGPSEASELIALARIESVRLSRKLMVIPVIETTAAHEQLDEILALDGLAAIFLGVSDLAQERSASGIEDPAFAELIASFIGDAHARHVAAAVNTGYAGGSDDAWELAIRRTQWLYDIGADIVFAEPALEFIRGQVGRFLRDAQAQPDRDILRAHTSQGDQPS